MRLFSDIVAVEARVAQLAERPALPGVVARDTGATFAALVSPGSSLSASTTAPEGRCIVKPATLERIIDRACAANGTDPALVKAIVANESGFNVAATSNAGAQGLMQLLPSTAASVGVTDSYDPQQNIAGGTRYLHGLLERFGGDIPRAVAAYNAGPGAVERAHIPQETVKYVHSVLASYAAYRDADRGPR